MLTKEELNFLKYWEAKRTTEYKSFSTFIKGLSRGLLIGIGILVLLSAGWYQRANMEANTKFNPFLMILIVIIIAIFIAFIYRQYYWEQNEQRYAEIMTKKKRFEKADTGLD